MLARERKNAATLLEARRHARRVLEGRVGIDQARPVACQMPLELFDVHAVGLQRHFEDPRADTAQRVDDAVIRGTLDDDRRPVRHQQPDDELDRLLGARGHDHVFRRRRQPLLREVFHDRTAKTDAAVWGVVGEIG